jgi:putative ABC transport system permease protein
MNALTLILKNLGRNRLRSGLTIAATALPAAFFLLTTAVRDVLETTVRQAAAELRLGVHNRVSVFNTVPQRARAVIEGLDPDRRMVSAVCGVRWVGGTVVGRPPFPFAVLAGDADTWGEVYPEYAPGAEAMADWHNYKNAAVVGRLTAEHYGWLAGGEAEVRTTVPPYMNLRFRIVAIHSGPNPRVLFTRMDFLDEELKRHGGDHGRANLYWVKCKEAAGMEPLGRRIDAAFANTPDETKCEDESTIIASIIKGRGDIPGKLQLVGTVAVLANIMVVANTMGLSFRERTGELALLRALGFSTVWVTRAVVAESLMMALIGGLFGILPVWAFFHFVPVTDIGMGPMPRFVVPVGSMMWAAGAVTAVGLAAGLAPALRVSRLRLVDALRKVG